MSTKDIRVSTGFERSSCMVLHSPRNPGQCMLVFREFPGRSIGPVSKYCFLHAVPPRLLPIEGITILPLKRVKNNRTPTHNRRRSLVGQRRVLVGDAIGVVGSIFTFS